MNKILKQIIDPKCKFWKTCEYKDEQHPVCNSDRQADGYCGKYRENEFQKKWK